jgi:diguanylate cyclase (GGDEF)-like protein
MRDPLIALGLRPQPANPDPSAVAQRLLDLLIEFVSDVDPVDTGTVLDRVDMYQRLHQANTDPEHLTTMTDACAEACRQVRERVKRHRRDQKTEMEALVALVHETLGTLAGTESGFHSDVGDSMNRIEALTRVDDVRQLKVQLAREIAQVRRLAIERQQAWEQTSLSLNDRVRTLEARLIETTRAATVDPLTQLTTRGAFESIAREWLASPRTQFVLALIDIDKLKFINDAHGHQAGDRAIVAVASALRNSFRADVDVVARYGGDEFALLAHDVGFRQAETRLRMLVTSLQSSPIELVAGESMTLTVSCGMAACSAGDTLESLNERADAALYEAKRAGRDRIIAKDKPTLRSLRQH